MKKILISTLFLLFIISIPFFAQAELLYTPNSLVFCLDFGQDGICEDYWILGPGETVLADIYISNIPEPGLIIMGFHIVYDPAVLKIPLASILPFWPGLGNVYLYPGVVEMIWGQLPCLLGDGIRLGTIKIKCIGLGSSELWLYDTDRGGAYDDFVLCDGTVLDPVGPILLGKVFCACIPCLGDFDDDGDVDGSDLAIFAADFGRIDCQTGPLCKGDFDDDDDVDGSDLAIFVADFGRTDCP